MIKIENVETVGWEPAIRGMYHGEGVRETGTGTFEAYVSSHGKFVSCGTFSTKEKAENAVISTKVKLFEAGVISHGDDISSVVPSEISGYFVTPTGNVYNKSGCIMVGAFDRCGYRHIIANKKNVNVHRLVAKAFIPNPKNLPFVNHKDGNKSNNSADNLEWVTRSENTLHSFKTGLQKKITNQYGTFEVKKYEY